MSHPYGQLLSAIKHSRILVKAENGHVSNPNAFHALFLNALMQSRTIATDGVLWWIQPSPSGYFKSISESEVPEATKEEFAHFFLVRFVEEEQRKAKL